MKSENISAEYLHRYWFGQIEETQSYIQKCIDIWFKKNEAVDLEINQNFSHLLTAYNRGFLKHWDLDTKSQIALIILLDQIPRHIFRNTAKAHQFDNEVSVMALDIIQSEMVRKMNPIELLFLYMPLQHSEMIALQNLSVKKYTELASKCPREWKDFFLIVLDMAKLHQDVIARFGRFPHRNTYLGRASTAKELELLKDPKYNF